MFIGIDGISAKMNENIGGSVLSDLEVNETSSREQDLENSIPKISAPNTDDVPIPLLAKDADLAQVVKVVNELIKRSLTIRRVE